MTNDFIQGYNQGIKAQAEHDNEMAQDIADRMRYRCMKHTECAGMVSICVRKLEVECMHRMELTV